jgi:hypothetical protein
MSAGIDRACVGCGRRTAGADLTDDLCEPCADDVRHGRPCGVDAYRGGLCEVGP